jgi:vacuolar-type H+-ATPase subunit E/Vma4
MTLNNLKHAILQEADEQARSTRATYAQEAEGEQQRLMTRVRELEEQVLAAAETTAQLEAAKIHQSARLAARAQILAHKQAALETLADALITRVLTNEPAAKAFLESLFTRLTPEPTGEIVAGAKHAPLVAKLAKKHGFKLSRDQRENDGGFVYRTSDQEINFLLRHLGHQVFTRHRATLALKLFGA